MSDPGTSTVMIDANALDRVGGDRDVLVDRFVSLMEAGLPVVVAGGVRQEALHPHTPRAVQDLVLSRAPATRSAPTHAQKLDRIRVRAILRGDAQSGKHDADAAHVSDAAETGCRYFVTHDRRLLRKRADLRHVLPPDLRIVTLERFLDLYDAGDIDG